MKTNLLLISFALLALTGASHAQIFYPTDNGFQDPALTSGDFVVAPSGTAWVYSAAFKDAESSPNESGVATNGSQNLVGATGGQAAFLQGVSSVSQSITLPTGLDSVSFSLEGRPVIPYPGPGGATVDTGPT